MPASQAPESLWVTGREVARYQQDPVPAELCPRPRLHPIRTLSGRVVTAERPADHDHHLGLSLAVSDLDGSSFWGGRVDPTGRSGDVPLGHGRQAGIPDVVEPGVLTDRVHWTDHTGRTCLIEERRITAEVLSPQRWLLRWQSLLRPSRPLRLASPAVNGRGGGATYGGIFWRFPAGGESAVHSHHGVGAAAVNGRTADRLIIRHRDVDGAATVVLHDPDDHPWFVRDAGYLGAGPALAATEALHLTPGTELSCALTAVVCDGWVDDIAALTAELATALDPAPAPDLATALDRTSTTKQAP